MFPIPKMRVNNPFPSQPRHLPFVSGRLISSSPAQSFPIGLSFLLRLHAHPSPSLLLSHLSNPSLSLWSTSPSASFLSAALATSHIHHSRGSFSIDHSHLHLLCNHQTIERIRVASPHNYASDFPSFQSFTPRAVDADGAKIDVTGPVIVVEGCLYSDPEIAQTQLAILCELETRGCQPSGPFYDTTELLASSSSSCLCVGVRYSFILSQQRDHQLGFAVQLGEPICCLASHSGQESINNNNRIGRLGLSDKSQSSQLEIRDRVLRLCNSGASIPGLTKLKHRLERISLVQFRKILFPIPWSRKAYQMIDNQRLLESNGETLQFNRIFLTYSTYKTERFFGFGEQFSYFDLKGKRVPVLVQEQGLGRGDQPITAAANLVAYRSGGDWHTTYAPVPFYMTSDLRSLYLEGYNFSVFDLRKDDVVHSNQIQGRILHGSTPLELIEHYTESTGRMRELPAWIIRGAVIGMQGGTEQVRRVWEQLQKLDVPISAFWLQDWVGQRKTSVGWQLWWNWEVDEDHYPGWSELMKDFRAKNVRTMTYFNPFLVSTEGKRNRRQNLFEEARNRGFLVQNKLGLPYMIPNTSFEAAMVDLTNPEARSWLKSIMHGLAKSGVRGWMADFGESLPFDACVFSGEDPASLHNRYPELWAKLNREVVDEWEASKQWRIGNSKQSNESTYLQEDQDDEESRLVFFMRAGYRESPRWATLFWEGDQMVSWQRHDGIKSAVVGLLSSGLSGFAFNHSDIGGYCTVDLPFLRYRRSEELLLRWMELNAFTTIYRTHEGNISSANSQFYSSDRTLLHFTRFAKVYKAWEFYRKQLVTEAANKGSPVVRHLFLHYPVDKHVQTITYQQFLVGSEILVVPCLDKGQRKIEAYLPGAEEKQLWQHIWSRRIYGRISSSHQQGQGFTIWIDCPLGEPAVFVKHKSPIGIRFLRNLTDLGL